MYFTSTSAGVVGAWFQMFSDSLQRPQRGGVREGSEGQRQCWNWNIEAHVWVAAKWATTMHRCLLFQEESGDLIFSFLPPACEDSWPGPQAKLRYGLPSPRRAGGRSLYQLLHLCYRLQTAVSWPHQLPAHVAPLVQSPVLQRLHHVCRCGPETFESCSIRLHCLFNWTSIKTKMLLDLIC